MVMMGDEVDKATLQAVVDALREAAHYMRMDSDTIDSRVANGFDYLARALEREL